MGASAVNSDANGVGLLVDYHAFDRVPAAKSHADYQSTATIRYPAAWRWKSGVAGEDGGPTKSPRNRMARWPLAGRHGRVEIQFHV